MAKGFKDGKGRFHPIEEHSSRISSKKLKTNPESSNPDSKRTSDLKKIKLNPYEDTNQKEEEFEPEYKLGDEVVMSESALQNYGRKYQGKVFTISHVATSRQEHQGYDESVGGGLYDLKDKKGNHLGFSLYDWELESA